MVEGLRAVAGMVPQRASGMRDVTDTFAPLGAVAVKIQLLYSTPCAPAASACPVVGP